MTVDGTYLLSNVKISSFRQEKHLSTTANTTVTASENRIQKIGGVAYERWTLSCTQIVKITSAKLCIKCKLDMAPTKKHPLRVRDGCAKTASYTVKVYFAANGGFTVTIFPEQIASLIAMSGEKVEDELDLSFILLNRADIEITYNRSTSFDKKL